MCLQLTHHVLEFFSECPSCLRPLYGHGEHQVFSRYHPCHMSTLTTSLLISSVAMMPTPLLFSSPLACSNSYTVANILSRSLFHFVSCIHYTSSFLLSIILTTSSAVLHIVPTLRLPIRTLHLGRCHKDDAPGFLRFLTTAGKCGTSITPDAVAKSTLGIHAIRNEMGHNTHCSAVLADPQCGLFLDI